MKIEVLKKFYGKTLTDLKAFGKDDYDFCRNLLGSDFSVGQFGYTVFEFGDDKIYISVDGLSETMPIRKNVKKLSVDEIVTDTFINSVLSCINFDGEEYFIEFEGMDILTGRYCHNEGLSDRSHFELTFPWC